MDTITLIALVACMFVLAMPIATLIRGDGYRFDLRKRRRHSSLLGIDRRKGDVPRRARPRRAA